MPIAQLPVPSTVIAAQKCRLLLPRYPDRFCPPLSQRATSDTWRIHLIPVRCYHQGMANRMPPEVLEYLRSVGKKFGKLGGKTAAKNMTAEERTARAKKASMAAARKRTAERLLREGPRRGKQEAKRKRSGGAT
jgi:hypothetical protein